jgi:hypothetical protein
MLVREMAEDLGLTVKTTTKKGGARKIEGGFTGDLLSHVMANAQPGYVWITVQTHDNIVAIASLLDLACIVVCQREIPEETCQRAASEGVTLMWTADGAFEVAGRLYAKLTV